MRKNLIKILAVVFLLFTFLAVSFADAQEVPRNDILLRMYHGSGWGVSGQLTRELRILSDGRVQCYHQVRVGWNHPECEDWRTAPDDCEFIWRAEVDRELPLLSAADVAAVNRQLAAIEGKDEVGGSRCFDETRRYFDTGYWESPDFNFWTVSLAEHCGQGGIDSPETFLLTARMEALYLQCPLLPADNEYDREVPEVPVARSNRRAP